MRDTDSTHDGFDGGINPANTDLCWEADFDSPENWRIERQQSGTVEFVDGQLHIDCIGERGVTVWTPQEFPTDHLIEYTATVHEPDDSVTSRNLNCFLCAADDEEPLAENSRSGSYDDYHVFPNYVFTLTRTHSRLRRNPGFKQVSELMLGAQPDVGYTVRILKHDGRLVATVNDHVLHDWTDEEPHGSGWVGLRTYNTDVTFDRWAVYAVK